MTETYSLSILAQLEAEAIHILREVAAEFERPVRLDTECKFAQTCPWRGDMCRTGPR